MFQPGDDLEKGAEGAGVGHGRAAHEGVGLGVEQHHGGVVAGVAQGLADVGDFEAVILPKLFELGGEGGDVFAGRGLDDADALEVERETGGGLLDSTAAAQQDRGAHAAGDPLARGLQHARIGAFGEDNALGVALESFGEFREERHGRGLRCALRAGRQCHTG